MAFGQRPSRPLESIITGSCEAVRRFAIRIDTGVSGAPITPYEGRNIGHKAICRLPLVTARQLRIDITESDGPAKLRGVSVHHAA